jgi:hypothetical protein
VKNLDGNPLRDGDKDLTVNDLCVRALCNAQSGAQATGEEKLKRAMLAERLLTVAPEKLELSAENITLIKACSAEWWMPWIHLQIVKTIDPNSLK